MLRALSIHTKYDCALAFLPLSLSLIFSLSDSLSAHTQSVGAHKYDYALAPEKKLVSRQSGLDLSSTPHAVSRSEGGGGGQGSETGGGGGGDGEGNDSVLGYQVEHLLYLSLFNRLCRTPSIFYIYSSALYN